MKTKCMSCGGSMKKMAKGGMPSKTPILGPPKKPFAAGIPYFIGAGQTGPSSMKKGGSVKSKMKKGSATKATKFAALAPPYNKATFADKIVGAKKNAKKK
jgi:hypothetical protein